ncbi:MAG: DUF2760 domain-containing protein [Desulfobacterales bacterium]|nr:DUF2760 domain-containing protein [Desulfobacterales bacterium]
MEMIKAFSRRSLFWIILFMAIIFLSIDLLIFLGLDIVFKDITAMTPENADVFSNDLSSWTKTVQGYFMKFFIPGSAVISALLAFIIWGVHRRIFRKVTTKYTPPAPLKKKKTTKQDMAAMEKEKKIHDTRMYLNILAVFQREGRLMDFFAENLDAFEDAQIGAAVRSIHENCKKTVNKLLSPRPIVDINEGEEFIVQKGFDPDSVKLIGNVAGEPPFKGVIRHKGWMAGKVQLPTLSSGTEAEIIAPAEVEII